MEEREFDNLEIYISYERLKAKDLALYLQNLSFVAEKVTEDYMLRFGENQFDPSDFPYLEVETIHTGNSIKFTLVEGWKPTISAVANEEIDIVIGVPKKLGIPLGVGLLLITVAYKYQDVKGQYLDNKIKEIELQLKRMELGKALTENSNDDNQPIQVEFYLNSKIPEAQPILADTVKNILQNPDIIKFKVNNIDIKGLNK